MPEIAVLLAGRRATISPVHPADAKAAYRGRTTALPSSFRFSLAPWRVVGALHGVDGHFDLVPPPTPTGSGCLVSLRIEAFAAQSLCSPKRDTITLVSLSMIVG